MSAASESVATARPAEWITAFLLAIILALAPLVLGATPLWYELPLLDFVALLIAIQGCRLIAKPPPDQSRKIDAIDLAVIAFVVYAVARWLTSPAEFISRTEVMSIVAYAGVFLTCRHGITNRRLGLSIIYLLVGLGVAETFLGYYLNKYPDKYPALLLVDGVNVSDSMRWSGTYAWPNHYVSLLIMAISSTVALGSFSRLPWPARIVFLYLGIVMIAGVAYSGSRGGDIALMVAIAGLVVMGIRNRTVSPWVPVTAALAFAFLAVILLLSSPVLQLRIKQTPNPMAGGNIHHEPRVGLAAEALRMAYDHPAFGTGPATFIFVHPHYQESRLDWKPEAAHDDYLNCIDDYGLVGFALAMFFVGGVTLKFFRPLEVDNRWQDRVVVFTGFAVWVALLFHSLVDYNLHVPSNALILFSLTGLAMGRMKDENRTHWSRISLSRLGPWLGIGILFISGAFAFFVTRTALSDWAYESASQHESTISPGEGVAAAEKALALDPVNVRARAFLGDTLRKLALTESTPEARMADGQRALEAYYQALQDNPLDDSLEYSIAVTLDQMQRYPEALPHYQTALAAQTHNGIYWHSLAIHYLGTGDLEQFDVALAKMNRCFVPGIWGDQLAERRREFVKARKEAKAPPTTAPAVPGP